MQNQNYRVILAHLERRGFDKDAGLKDVARKFLAPAALAVQTLLAAMPAQAANVDIKQFKTEMSLINTQTGDIKPTLQVLMRAIKELRAKQRQEHAQLTERFITLKKTKGERPAITWLQEQKDKYGKASSWLEQSLAFGAGWVKDRMAENAANEDSHNIDELRAQIESLKKETDRTFERLIDIADGQLVEISYNQFLDGKDVGLATIEDTIATDNTPLKSKLKTFLYDPKK